MNIYKKNITAVIVLYNVTEIILECLKNLKNIDIIIADNGDNDREIVEKIKSYSNIKKYFKFKKNIGFGRACNFCFKYVETDYTLFIEPDVLIDEKNIKILHDGFSKYPKAGILVPTLVNQDNIIIDKLDNLPELNNLQKHFPVSNNFHGDVCVNFCWAAIILVNNDIIRKSGLFEKKIFLFWEDFYLFRKLKNSKIETIKIYNARAFHKERASTKINFKTSFIIHKHHILSSYIYFNVSKKNFILKKKLLVYLFRTITYLLIFNFKNSLKNLARLCAVITFLSQK